VYSVYLGPRLPTEVRAPIVASLERDTKYRRPPEPPVVAAFGTGPTTPIQPL